MHVDIVTKLCTCHLIQSSLAVVFAFLKLLFKLLSLDLTCSRTYLSLRLKTHYCVVNHVRPLA